MACSDMTCGTGGWTGPLPGDPDNSSLLSATGDAGGINVSWTYPVLNPFAVSHVILYRGITPLFAGAVEYATVGGNRFFDKIADADIREYFYWIKLVSINGTYGDLIGPASATPLSSIAQIIMGLTGQIDAGVLAQSLRTEIDRIDLISGDLAGETADRIAAGAAFSTALAAVQTDTDQVMTYILNEIATRTADDQAIVTSVNALAVGVSDNAAAILNQQSVMAAADSAMASDITLLYGRVDTADAAVLTEASARATADTSLASQITTAQSTLNGSIASVQTTLQTNIDTVDGKATAIGARYTAVVDVNGLIGGFGVYNDGTSVEAGFDVDRFWIGRTVNKVKPFIIDGTTVYINTAMIASASIDTAKIADAAITNAKIANASITNAKIGNLAVDTIKIAGNAVTTAGFMSSNTGWILDGQTANSGALWVNFPIAPQSTILQVTATMVNQSGASVNCTITVKRSDGATIGHSGISIEQARTGNFSLSCIDSPPPTGNYYYYAEIYNQYSGSGGYVKAEPITIVSLSNMR